MTTYSKQQIPEVWSSRKPAIELDIIADVDSIGGYEWDRFVVLRDPSDGRLYTIDGSGCSCNYLFQDVGGLRDLDGPFTMQQVAARAQAWERADGDEWMAERRRGLGADIVGSLMRMERQS